MQHRGFSYRIYPTPEQEEQFRRFAGVCRLVYNLALEQRRDFWRVCPGVRGRRRTYSNGDKTMLTDLIIELTFCDHERNEFVPLKTYAFDSLEKLNRYWNTIPAGPAGSPYVADRHDAEGMTDNRMVTPEWIESIAGASVADLIAASRSRAH